MKRFLLLLMLAVGPLVAADPTVLWAILARNKAHTLPLYLQCLEKMDYDKQSIVVYINTNNNEDNTLQILQEWAEKHRTEYRQILFEEHQVEGMVPTRAHQWTQKRLKTLAAIRQKSLQMAKEAGCDFYFVADCDNFLIPETLRDLVNQDKPIIAPLLRSIPMPHDCYANYFPGVTETGYYDTSPELRPQDALFRSRKVTGVFKVPVVHCAYLVKTENVDKLHYGDETERHEFIIFCDSARKAGIDQFITNERDYGCQIHFEDDSYLSREQILEREKMVMADLEKGVIR
jgi:hypothetical protein